MTTQTLFNETITVKHQSRVLFDEKININTGNHICIIGPNGTGKTSMLEIINEKLSLTLPTIYIKQDITMDKVDTTILDYVLQADKEMYEAKLKVDQIDIDGDLSEEELKEYTELNDFLINKGWPVYEAKAKKILVGIGINNYNKKLDLLSGGWKTRVALGKALLIEPQLLILDEPTNHLDLNGVIWLTDYLSDYPKTLIVVTHMVNFVNQVATHTWLLKNYDGISQKLIKATGGYTNIMRTLAETTKALQSQYDKIQRRIKELQNKSTPKKEVQEFRDANPVTQPPKDQLTHFIFEDDVDHGTSNIISLNSVNFRYQNATKSIFKGIDLGINASSRYVIVGENGAGKSTLFNLCAGIIEPTKGEIERKRNSRISIYNQDIVSSLELDKTAVEFLQEKFGMSLNECRAHLGRVGFKRNGTFDPCNIKVKDLSGGYKARLAMVKIILEQPSVILLDEPTNHLDIDTIKALVESLNNFNGGIMVITHDVDFIESLEDHQILEVRDKTIIKRDSIDSYIADVVQ